jgi:hypothetical protein
MLAGGIFLPAMMERKVSLRTAGGIIRFHRFWGRDAPRLPVLTFWGNCVRRDIRIRVNLVFVIFQKDLTIFPTEKIVIGKNRYFSPSSRSIDDKMGDGHSGDISLERLHDGNSFIDRGPEMIGSPGEVGLIEIIGFDTDLQKALEEGSQNLGIVIDPFHENGLTSQGNSGISQEAACLRRFRSYLPGMVEMKIHIEGMKSGEHSTKCRGHSLGEG